MRVWVFNSYFVTKNSIEGYVSPHLYNSNLLYELLKEAGIDIEFVTSSTVEKKIMSGERCDVFIFGYRSHYMPFEALGKLAEKLRKVVIFINDYQTLISFGKDVLLKALEEKQVGIDVVISVEEKILSMKRLYLQPLIKNWWSVNMNILRYDNEVWREVRSSFFKEPLIYYGGGFRDGRKEYFLKYLNDERVTVSISKKRKKIWEDNGIKKCKFIDKLSWGGIDKSGVWLSDFESSLYIEDKLSHVIYTYLANRFYEALSYNVGVWFDIDCKNTVERAVREEGYMIDDWWFVSSTDEIFKKLESKEFNSRKAEFLEKNRKVALNIRNRTIDRIRDIFIKEILI